MAKVTLQGVSFSYPVFEVGARSLKVSLFSQMSGGSVGTHAGIVRVEALKNVSFTAKDGDRIGLIGRNGSGKSTLLRLLAGLAYPESGELKIEGRVVPLIAPGLGINPELSGAANIELPLRLLGATSAEVKRARREIPEFTGLGEFINLPVRTYSEGMKARLNFAICTAIEADVLILDEWLAAGDVDFQDRAKERLKAMVDRTRILIITSHSLELIREVCNVAVWMDRGLQVMTGHTSSVINSYLSSMRPLGVAAE
jgi:ABC-type polysaccharide/polyol phosphate transport system ATPase subunit